MHFKFRFLQLTLKHGLQFVKRLKNPQKVCAAWRSVAVLYGERRGNRDTPCNLVDGAIGFIKKQGVL
ncbi:MAG: hypothetical protein EBX42_11510 [Betaproteobacteria bacterium]|nr:hypothetical protein [Betaproteobacteria bacterium]